jgi:uncharacterized protein YabE (DUF348 family)
VRSRLVVASAYGVIAAASLAGTTAFSAHDNNVTISADGQLTHVRTSASSVDAVLHGAGVTLGVHDSVTPTTSTPVHDGTAITVLSGRLITLTVDGVARQVWVTAANVDQALQQAGVRSRGAVVSADRGARIPLAGMNIRVDLSHITTVQVDGVLHSIVGTESTLGAVLADAGITLNPTDQISTPLETRPFDGLSVVIVRLSSGQQLETAPIPFTTATRPDPNGLVGTKKVLQAGHNGTLARTYQLAFTDGLQTGKTLVGQQVTLAPVQQIIGIGAKPKPAPKPQPVYAAAADGLNWAALAGCESGGRPNAVRAPFYGLYQFRVGTWQAVGGKGLPSDASASEQTYRAQLLYQRSNWRTQWPVCGHYLFA